ncbi:cyclin-dependent kinase inhibitor 3 family protein [Vibrio hangzhouensis]|uniref:Protein-tyrosine phosphatase n=1 Tax=Vibrio hangzhouensis TaxID=462991 RepID=A0A1H5XIK8_9VIBR|nr:cyclin-dependent kinase inhibitor 3 family protein [Vibrio hangzhouensis]SEG11076.1 Protein-tyrosine phosphatase [Vibrio hangzhouensis]
MMHPTWELNVDNAALVLTPCPGTKGTSLDESLAQLKEQGVTIIVTALDEHEMIAKGVSELGQKAKALGMKWFQTPIEDDQAPGEDFAADWKTIAPELHQAVNAGEKIVMHCMGGSGRTGLLAANLLLEKGWDLETIRREVQALRPGAFTKQPQIDYVEKLAATF